MTMKPPSHIWLQWYGDASPADHEYDERPEGTTFSTEKVYEDDVCYVRAGKPNQRVQSALIAAEARAAELAAAVDRLRAAAVWKNSYTTPPAHGANVVFANFGGVVAYVAHYHHGGYAPPWYFVPPPIPNEISDEHAADYQEHERLVDLVDRLQRENTARADELAAEVAAVNAELESALAVVALYQQRALTAEGERDDANIEVEAGNMRLVELAAEVERLTADNAARQAMLDAAATEEHKRQNEIAMLEEALDINEAETAALRAQLAAAGQEWRPVDEPPTEDGRFIVDWIGGDDDQAISLYSSFCNVWLYDGSDEPLPVQPTHYQPLPAPLQE